MPPDRAQKHSGMGHFGGGQCFWPRSQGGKDAVCLDIDYKGPGPSQILPLNETQSENALFLRINDQARRPLRKRRHGSRGATWTRPCCWTVGDTDPRFLFADSQSAARCQTCAATAEPAVDPLPLAAISAPTRAGQGLPGPGPPHRCFVVAS